MVDITSSDRYGRVFLFVSCSLEGSIQCWQYLQELAAAAKAADKVLKHHKQRAAEELQATEASWSAMASDLQEQVTDMQQRTRTLECECDDLRKQLEGANDVTARKMKEAEVCNKLTSPF